MIEYKEAYCHFRKKSNVTGNRVPLSSLSCFLSLSIRFDNNILLGLFLSIHYI